MVDLNPIHAITHVAHDVENDVVDPVYRDVLHPLNRKVFTPLGIGSDNWTQSYNDINNWGNDVLDKLNQGIGWVQHYYRYVHEQWTRHGVIEGLAALGPGNVLNSATNTATGGVLPGHDVTQEHAWSTTEDGATYRDIHGHVVNFGYDAMRRIETALPFHKDTYTPPGFHDADGVEISNAADPTAPLSEQLATPTNSFDFASGALNAAFDVALDPTLKVTKAIGAAKAAGVVFGGERIALSADEVERAAQLQKLEDSGKRYAVASDGKSAFISGRTLVGPRKVKTWYDDLGRIDANNVAQIAVDNPGVWDAFGHIANMQTTEQVLAAYPQFRGMAKTLAEASTRGEVIKAFEEAVNAKNYGFLLRGLPTTSIGRRLAEKFSTDGLGIDDELPDLLDPTAASPGTGLATNSQIASRFAERNKLFHMATAYRPFTVDGKTMRLSATEFDPEDPNALDGIYRALRMSRSPAEANIVMARYLESPDLSARVSILSRAFHDSLRVLGAGRGLTDDEIRAMPQMGKWYGEAERLLKGGFRRGYGRDMDGKPIVPIDKNDGSPMNLALSIKQTGKIAFPNWNQFRRDVNKIVRERDGMWWENGKLRGHLGAMDEWASDHLVQPWKALVLSTVGFALRIGASELIPALIQNGAAAMARGVATAIGAKLTWKELLAERGRNAFGNVRVVTADGRHALIRSIDPEGNALLDSGEIHRLDDLDAVHTPIPDEDIRTMAGQLGIELDDQEVPHIKAAIGKALFGVADALGDDGWHYREQAKWNVLNFGGHTFSPGTAADAIDSDSLGIDQANSVKRILDRLHANTEATKLSGDSWTEYHNHQAEQPLFHHYQLVMHAKDPGIRAAAEEYLRAIDGGADMEEASRRAALADAAWQKGDSEEAQYLGRSLAIRSQYSPEEFAAMRTRLIKGLSYGGESRELQRDIMEGLAGRREVPTALELAKKEFVHRPIAVDGRELVPPIRRLLLHYPMRFVDAFWRKAIDPIINGMSRSPIFTVRSGQEFARLYPAVKAGRLSQDEAHHIAALRATEDTLKIVHNPKLRSQMSDLVRNIFPFYFAQEQAYRRYGYVSLANLTAFRRALLVKHGLTNSGAIQSDDQGNQSVVFPGGSEFAKLVAGFADSVGLPVQGGIPVTYGGNTISLRTVVPEAVAPNISPLVSIPLKAVQHYDPAWQGLVTKIIGNVDEQTSMWDQLVPNSFLRRALQAYGPLDHEAAFQTSMAYAMAAAKMRADEFRSQAAAASDPTEKARLLAKADAWMPGPTATNAQMQAAADRIRNTARIYMAAKAAYGLFSPLAPTMDVGDVPLRDEAQADIAKYGLADGLQHFIDKHPDATAYTVFLSDNHATGTSPPATQTALDWIDRNRGYVKNHQLAAAYLVPQSAGNFSPSAYNQELATGLRTRRPIVGPKDDPAAPGTFLAALYAAATDVEYYKSLDTYLATQKQLAGNSLALSDLASQFHQYKDALGRANPVWLASHNDGDKVRVAQNALRDLKATIEDGTAPDSPQTGYAQELISSWTSYEQVQAGINNGSLTGSLSDLKDQFNSYLDQYATANPAASALVTGIFRRLVNDGPGS